MTIKNYSNQYIPRDKSVAGVRVAFENGNYVRSDGNPRPAETQRDAANYQAGNS